MSTPLPIYLTRGAHEAPSDGLCLLEAVSNYFNGEHTDDPRCVSPLLASFGRRLNDYLPDDLRQRLVPFVPRMINTNDDGLDVARSFLVLDWLVRTLLPNRLDKAGRHEDADYLRSLHQITDEPSAYAAKDALTSARLDTFTVTSYYILVIYSISPWTSGELIKAASRFIGQTADRDLYIEAINLLDRMISGGNYA